MSSASKDSCAIFLDTNCLIHYKSIDQIDWKRLSCYDQVSLMVAPIVLKELNRHKDRGDRPSIKKRARSVIALLRRLSTSPTPGRVRDGVNLHLVTQEPLIDFTADDLDREVDDDRLIASAVSWARKNSSVAVLLAAGDFAVEIKTRTRPELTFLPLPEDLVLPLDDSEQRELRELRAKVSKLESAAPQLKLRGAGNSQVELHFRDPLDSSDRLDRILYHLKQKYRGMSIPSQATLGKQLIWGGVKTLEAFQLKQDDIDLYNGNIQKFFSDYRTWYITYESSLNFRRLSAILSLLLENDGNKAAEDIHIALHFPDGFEVAEDYPVLERSPRPPSEPIPLALRNIQAWDSVPHTRAIARTTTSHEKLLGSAVLKSLRRTNSYDLEIVIPRLRQRSDFDLPAMIIHFESADQIKSFEVEYKVTAGNSPTCFDGTLPVQCLAPSHR
jgi:hypothetical protein